MAKPRRLIKQQTLQDILDKRALLDGLKRDLKVAEDDLSKAEALLMYDIEQGAPTEPGLRAASIAITTRRNVAWKEVFARVAGPAAVEQEMAAATPTEYKKLVVVRGNGA